MVEIDKALCIGCGKCVHDCISMSLKLDDNKAVYNRECIHCGHCVAICPAGAVSIPEYDMADVREHKSGQGLTIEQLLDAVRFRRSIRDYENKPIDRQVLDNIVNAGRYTATGGNRQACRFVVVQERLEVFKGIVWDGVEQLVSAGEGGEAAAALKRLVNLRREKGIDYLFRNAPAVLFVAAESAVDAGLAAQNMELAAVAQGLGAMYNGYLARAATLNQAACQWLELGEKPAAVSMLLGTPAVQYRRSAPRRAADVVWR